MRLVHDQTTKKLLALKSLKRRNINKYLESEIVNHSLLRSGLPQPQGRGGGSQRSRFSAHMPCRAPCTRAACALQPKSPPPPPRTHCGASQQAMPDAPGDPALPPRPRRHPHVVQFREVFLTQEHVCILMEYANGGSLFDLVRTQKRLKETQARWFFQQVGACVRALLGRACGG